MAAYMVCEKVVGLSQTRQALWIQRGARNSRESIKSMIAYVVLALVMVGLGVGAMETVAVPTVQLAARLSANQHVPTWPSFLVNVEVAVIVSLASAV